MRTLPLLVLLLLVALAPAAAAKGTPVLDCPQHIEGTGPLPGPDAARDVSRSVLTLMGARRLQEHRVPIGTHVRLGIKLAAAYEATIEVAPESQRFALLEYRMVGSGRIAESHLDLSACPPDEPRFSGSGTVGRWTVWAGGLRVRRPGCVTLRVQVNAAAEDVRLPLGRPCRPPRATRTLRCAEGVPAENASARLEAGPLGLVPARTGTQALLLPRGASATVSVAWEQRRLAALRVDGEAGVRAVRATACGRLPATSWPVALAATDRPACVALDVWPGTGPARRLRVPAGAPDACLD